MNNRASATRRPRLLDVAAEARVSIGAASKALSHPDAVRPGTLAAVRAAVEKLGYIASDRGRALASRYSGTVGVVLPTISNPVFATFVHGLQAALWPSDHQLLVLSHEYDRALETVQVERLVQRGVDALILVGTDHPATTRTLLDKLHLPHLFTWSTDSAAQGRVIGFSNRLAMHRVVDHLAALGHRRIAVLGGRTDDNERARWRLAGIEEAAARAGIDIVATQTADLTIEGGRAGFGALGQDIRRATALVCATDTLAAGALDAARQVGLDIPRALSLTGFDDIELAALLSPPLTTVRAPIAEMAMHAGEGVLAILAGEPVEDCVNLPTELVVRASTTTPTTARS